MDWTLAVLTPLFGLAGAFLGSVLGPGTNDRRALAMRLLKLQEDAYIDALTYADRATRLIYLATSPLTDVAALRPEEVDLAPAHALGARLRLYAEENIHSAWVEFRRLDMALQDYQAIPASPRISRLTLESEELTELRKAANDLTTACRTSLRTRSGRWRRPWW